MIERIWIIDMQIVSEGTLTMLSSNYIHTT